MTRVAQPFGVTCHATVAVVVELREELAHLGVGRGRVAQEQHNWRGTRCHLRGECSPRLDDLVCVEAACVQRVGTLLGWDRSFAGQGTRPYRAPKSGFTD